MTEKKVKVRSENLLLERAMAGHVDMEIMDWLGGDPLKLVYILGDLKRGSSIRDVAKRYSVSQEGIRKYCFEK